MPRHAWLAIPTLLAGSILAPGPLRADPGRPDRPSAADLGVVPRTLYVRVGPPLPERSGAMFSGGSRTVIFMNRQGGRFTPGWVDNAVSNVSSIVQFDTDMPPYPYGDDSWNRVVECVRQAYADFDVEVTDEDPGASPHVEVVVSGHPNDLGLQDSVGGVAPMACQAIPAAVTFAFPETYGDNPEGICEAAGQESAHAFGLDHEMLCNDLMTYLSCGPKSFVDEDAECGEFQARPCACGGETQNSYRYLLDVLGSAPPRSDPPVVTLVSPADGDEVEVGFGVEVDVADDGLITNLELRIDGERVDGRFAEPWAFRAPNDIALGAHTLEVIATDDTRVEGSAVAHIEVVEDAGGSGRRRGGCAAAGGGALGPGWAVLAAGLALAVARRREGIRHLFRAGRAA